MVITDYPDPELIENIRINVQTNIPEDKRSRVDVQVCILLSLVSRHDLSSFQGHIWGRDVSPLFALLQESKKFDVIFMSDLIFNHSQVCLGISK